MPGTVHTTPGRHAHILHSLGVPTPCALRVTLRGLQPEQTPPWSTSGAGSAVALLWLPQSPKMTHAEVFLGSVRLAWPPVPWDWL